MVNGKPPLNHETTNQTEAEVAFSAAISTESGPAPGLSFHVQDGANAG